MSGSIRDSNAYTVSDSVGILNAEMYDDTVADYIRGLHLRRRLLGVDEKEVWSTAAAICSYYEERDRSRKALIETLADQLADRDSRITKLEMYINMLRKGR